MVAEVRSTRLAFDDIAQSLKRSASFPSFITRVHASARGVATTETAVGAIQRGLPVVEDSAKQNTIYMRDSHLKNITYSAT
jgi:hypothetical protein